MGKAQNTPRAEEDPRMEQSGPPPLPSIRTFVVKLENNPDRVVEAHGVTWDENSVASFYCYVQEPVIGVMQKVHLVLQSHCWDIIEEQREFARPSSGPTSILIN